LSGRTFIAFEAVVVVKIIIRNISTARENRQW